MKKCIYCDQGFDKLTLEHIIPAGLGGNIKLASASCKKCAETTSKVEIQILRGHWWAYRRYNKVGSNRHKNIKPPPVKVKIIKSNGDALDGLIDIDNYPLAMMFILFRPTILEASEQTKKDVPFAKTVGMVTVREFPQEYRLLDDRIRRVLSTDKIEYPVQVSGNEFSAEIFMRFLAKIAHSFAIKELSIEYFSEVYLQDIILGKSKRSMEYIGSASSTLHGVQLKNNCGVHHVSVYRRKDYVTVLIQLFNLPTEDPKPIYEIVVGKHNC